jgi:hypothetical protein
MLIFVDQEKHIRVVRTSTEDGVTSRSPIGRVMKNRLEVNDDLRAVLEPDEFVEVEKVIEIYKRAQTLKVENYALNFPVIIREVMDRFEEEASQAERQVVMGALMEAVRRMRKFQRDGQAA